MGGYYNYYKIIRGFKHILDDLDYDMKVRTHEVFLSNLVNTLRNTDQDVYHHVAHKKKVNKCDHHFKADVY